MTAWIISFCVFLYFIVSPGGRTDNYLVQKTLFSSRKFDEFSPVYYKNSIVFCSNRNSLSIEGISAKGEKGFFRLFCLDTAKGSKIKPLPGKINSRLNSGPVTFNSRGDTAYFSGNLVAVGRAKEIAGPGNKLGLFSAVLRNGEWIDITPLRFNDNAWNVTTPFLSHDGKYLYFASDRPDGLGGSDIYSCTWEEDYWSNPVNLGPPINTSGNEAYPFINENGDFFFSSDGLPGKGGKDIFYTRLVDNGWITPVNLNAPVNSASNDFGFYTDDIISSGFFSSDRGGALDIYSFKTVIPQFFSCPEQEEPTSCFSFSDDASIEIDTLLLQYRWRFDNKFSYGISATQCFDNPGNYPVDEDIVEKYSGRIVMNKLKTHVTVNYDKMPYIKPVNVSSADNLSKFTTESGSDDLEVISAFWDFGNNEQEKGSSIDHRFAMEGMHEVKLLVNLKSKTSGFRKQVCVTRKIFTGREQRLRFGKRVEYVKPGDGGNISGNTVFRVQLKISEKMILTDSPEFWDILKLFPVLVEADSTRGGYSCYIDERQDFMGAYQSYKSAAELGFNEAIIVSHALSGTAERDIWHFKRTFGTSADAWFVNNGVSISPKMTEALEELVLILNRHRLMRLLIAVHGDNAEASDTRTHAAKQAENIAGYLAEMGIDRSRLTSAGYASDNGSDQEGNRRVDFILIPLQ